MKTRTLNPSPRGSIPASDHHLPHFAKFLFLFLELFRFSPLLASPTSAKPHNSAHTINIKLIYINLIWFKSTVFKSSVNLGLLLKVTPPTPILCLYICLCMQPSHYFILFTRDSEFIFALHYSTLQQFILLTRGSEFIFIFHQFTFQYVILLTRGSEFIINSYNWIP